MTAKDFIADSFMRDKQRYGTDDGDLNLINDYLVLIGWDTITREQFRAITTIQRLRNMFLYDNPDCNLRQKHNPACFIQLSIFDYLDDETATQTQKLTAYFAGDKDRVNQTKSRIKKSVRGVNDQHITATKLMLPLLVSNPTLKKIREKRRQGKPPSDGTLIGDLIGDLETDKKEGSR